MPSRFSNSEVRFTAAVSCAVADIEDPPGGRQVDLRAGGALSVSGGQSRGRLHGREGAVRVVKPVGGDAAALLVREVDDVETRMMDVVAGGEQGPPVNPV